MVAAAGVGLLAACDGAGPPAAEELQLPGDASARIEAGEPAPAAEVGRIVSLSPLASATLVAIGAAESLVAVDETSAQLPALRGLEIVGGLDELEMPGREALAPDLVLLPLALLPGGEIPGGEIGWSRDLAAARLRGRGVDVIEVSVHDLEDAYRLARELGRRLGRADEIEERVRNASRPLAGISATSFGQPRPRIAAIASLDPLTLAGGHSFATDLVEIAGAESVTHGIDTPRVEVSIEELRAMQPQLVLMLSPRPLAPAQQASARERLAAIAPLEFVVFDPERFLSRDVEAAARKLRSRVVALSGQPESASRLPR